MDCKSLLPCWFFGWILYCLPHHAFLFSAQVFVCFFLLKLFASSPASSPPSSTSDLLSDDASLHLFVYQPSSLTSARKTCSQLPRDLRPQTHNFDVKSLSPQYVHVLYHLITTLVKFYAVFSIFSSLNVNVKILLLAPSSYNQHYNPSY